MIVAWQKFVRYVNAEDVTCQEWSQWAVLTWEVLNPVRRTKPTHPPSLGLSPALSGGLCWTTLVPPLMTWSRESLPRSRFSCGVESSNGSCEIWDKWKFQHTEFFLTEHLLVLELCHDKINYPCLKYWSFFSFAEQLFCDHHSPQKTVKTACLKKLTH